MSDPTAEELDEWIADIERNGTDKERAALMRTQRRIREAIDNRMDLEAWRLLIEDDAGLTRGPLEGRLATHLEYWARRDLPAWVVFELDIELDDLATPGTLRLVIRTEGKWGRRWRLFRAWCAQWRQR